MAERNSGQCGGESSGSHRLRHPELRPPTDLPMESIESMYIHPAVRFQCAYAGHKGGFTVGMRPARIVSFVSSCTLVRLMSQFSMFHVSCMPPSNSEGRVTSGLTKELMAGYFSMFHVSCMSLFNSEGRVTSGLTKELIADYFSNTLWYDVNVNGMCARW